jgi:phospholipid/cholesterol/gamma-HCH transport system substrate-binding protein
MTRFSVEAKVGFFVVIGIAVLAYMSMKSGRFEYAGKKGYELYALFDSAEGLIKGVPVEVAGIEVGQVKDLTLEGGKAKVVFQISPELRIGKDAWAIIRTKGVLGDKYVEIVLGSPDSEIIDPGGRIPRSQSPANIDTLLKQLSSIGEDIKEITGSLTGVMGDEEGKASLRIIMDNMREMTVALNETIQKNNDNINRMLQNLTVFSTDLRQISGNNKEAISETVANFRQASADLRKTLIALGEITEKINRGEGTMGQLIHEEQTIQRLNETLVALKDIAERINQGEGTIGRLVQEDETVENLNETLTGINKYLKTDDRFRTYLDYHGEYLFDAEDVKSYLSLRIQPKEDKYYLLGIVDDPAGTKEVSETTTTVDGISTTTRVEKIDEDEIKFSAQIAKRYYDLGLRGGIFESEGGVGADYYFLDDRIVLSFEAFDFDPDEEAHLKLKLDFTPFQYVYLTAGLDDFISREDNESFFVGGGIYFSDEDIKTLISNAPTR